MKEAITLTSTSTKEQYDRLFAMAEKTIFKVPSEDYETVMLRMEQYKPTEGEFEVFPINPGTETYSLTGPDHLVITKNTLIVTD